MATSIAQSNSRQEWVWTTDQFGRPVRRLASALTEEQKAALKQAEERVAYEIAFCIFEEVQA